MEILKKQLYAECGYRMKEETVERFLGLTTRIKLKNKEPLIPYGKMDDNVYILKEGIVREVYFDGVQERTFAFALPGTVMISYYSFYAHEATFFQLEACCDTVVLKVSKAEFDEMFQQSRDFANWAFKISASQLHSYEMKLALINGTAKERLEGLMKNRPEVAKIVSNKVIAQYIGISQSYLSHLKREILSKSKG